MENLESNSNKTELLHGDDESIATSASVESSRKFSDYKTIRKIGEGSFGKVYLCSLDDQAYAIKVLKKSRVL